MSREYYGSIHKELLEKDRSLSEKYADIGVGRKEILRLIKHDLIVLCCSGMPGALELFLRKVFYPRLFGSVGRGVVFGRNIVFRHPGRITIGEFSRVTQITIKALRLYHDKGILIPDAVGDSSGYRYYGPQAVERALTVKRLKEMGFSLDEIREILEECKDDGPSHPGGIHQGARVHFPRKSQELPD